MTSDDLYSRKKAVHVLEDYSNSQAVEHCSQGIWGKKEFCRTLEEGTWKQAWLAGSLG